MTPRMVLAVLGVLAAAAVSSAVAHRYVCARHTVPLERLSDANFLSRELDLSADQTDAVRRQQEALGAKLSECCARHCDFRARLATCLAGGGDARELIAAMGREYETGERLTWEHIQVVRALLDDGQRRRYDALVTRCFGGECNMESKPTAM